MFILYNLLSYDPKSAIIVTCVGLWYKHWAVCYVIVACCSVQCQVLPYNAINIKPNVPLTGGSDQVRPGFTELPPV